MTKYAKQIGSIRTFLVVGIILTCLLVGSLAILKNRNDSIVDKKSQPTSETKDNTKKDDTTKNDTNKNTVDFGGTTNQNTTSNDESTKSSELPTTGPESTLISMVAVFILTVGVFEFVNYRKTKNTYFDL